MSTSLKIEPAGTTAPRAHYEAIAYNTLRILWRRKRMIGAMVLAAVSLCAVALALMGPRYTSEAIVRLNFSREEQAGSAKTQPIANLDAVALVDGAARMIRSQATASAAVSRYGLENDPLFARGAARSGMFSALRSKFGLAISQHDRVVGELMRRVKVTTEPRSYLISVAVTTESARQSMRLANIVALEYLRGQMLQQLTEAQSAAEREMADLTATYGMRHPNYLRGVTRLEDLRARLSALRDEAPSEDVAKLVVGQQFIAAQNVLVPTGPNVLTVLGLVSLGALAAGSWIALLLERKFLRVSDFTIAGRRLRGNIGSLQWTNILSGLRNAAPDMVGWASRILKWPR